MNLPLPPSISLAVTPAEYDSIQTALGLVAALREKLAGQVHRQRTELLEARAKEERAAAASASRHELEGIFHE